MMRQILPQIVGCVLIGPLSCLAAPPEEPAIGVDRPSLAGVPTAPHETRGDDYVPVPPEARRIGPAPRWSRNGFVSIQVNTDAEGNNILDDAANEPSIAVDTNRPNWLVIGWRQFDTINSDFRQAGWAYSHDGGRTWTFPGVIDAGVFRSDPVLDADTEGNFYYNSLTIDPYYYCDIFKSTDGGVTWGEGVYAFGGDKTWMAIDRTGGIGADNIYHAWDYAGCCGDDWFTRSTDGAETFDPPVPVPERPMWGVTTVDAEGNVYVAGRRYSTNQQYIVAKSSTAQDPGVPLQFDGAVQVDLGGDFEYFLGSGPNPGGLMGQVWIAADHSDGPYAGNLYVLSSVNPPGPDPMDVHFIRSTDGGLTWSDPVRVNDDDNDAAWQWFATMAVSPDGRIDVIFNDTRNDSTGGTMSELFYTCSTDAGETWATNEPISPAFDPLIGWPQQNKLGDYYDMVSDRLGAHVAYAATFNGEQDVYYLRVGEYDCNGNGIPDPQDIADGTSGDCNANGIPDECEFPPPCPGDLDGDCVVGTADLLALLAAWGEAGGPADLNDDGTVNTADLLLLLGAWGPCA
ncbi:MAG: sialidase family protein [Planctomycetota bacterium]|nr:sialidase family protein [Planctomycetota bacterium]